MLNSVKPTTSIFFASFDSSSGKSLIIEGKNTNDIKGTKKIKGQLILLMYPPKTTPIAEDN